MQLNEYGRIVEWTWRDLPNHGANVQLDAFVIMPNHVHGIIVITDVVVGGVVEAGSEPAPTTKQHALPEIVRQLKTFSARRINRQRGISGVSVWQRNYYEHIIRNAHEMQRIRAYIHNNPTKWALDRDNPQKITGRRA